MDNLIQAHQRLSSIFDKILESARHYCEIEMAYSATSSWMGSRDKKYGTLSLKEAIAFRFNIENFKGEDETLRNEANITYNNTYKVLCGEFLELANKYLPNYEIIDMGNGYGVYCYDNSFAWGKLNHLKEALKENISTLTMLYDAFKQLGLPLMLNGDKYDAE